MSFTPNQKLQLLALNDAGAVSRDTSKPADDLPMGNTLVIGKLRDLGLAESRTVQRGRQQWTEYWLTAPGVAEARALLLTRASS